MQIDPTYASVAAIAAGDYDDYLRSYADSVRDFGHAVVIGFGHEMNAPWYSWGYGHVPPATFVAAWRHIVTVFRGEGADNVTWLWTINQDRGGTGPIASWWPGAKYVTWVGIDGYYFRPTDTFTTVFGQHHRSGAGAHQQADPALGDRRGPAGRAVREDRRPVRGMRKYQTLGLVWFDKDQDDGHLPPGLADRKRPAATPRSGSASPS